MKQATRCGRTRICCAVVWRRTEPRRVPNDLVLRLPRALQPGLRSLHFLRLGCNSESSYTSKRYPISERFPTILQFPIVRNLQISMDIDRSKLGRIRCASELRERLETAGNRQAERGVSGDGWQGVSDHQKPRGSCTGDLRIDGRTG